jgi:hypothetical protein
MLLPGADPGFQVRGSALKKIAPSGGRRENIWGISSEKSAPAHNSCIKNETRVREGRLHSKSVRVY